MSDVTTLFYPILALNQANRLNSARSLRTEDGLLELQDESRERQVALLSHFDRTTCENNDQRNALEALIRQSFMRFQREMSQQLEVHINKIEDHTTRKTVRRIGGEPQQNMGAASKVLYLDLDSLVPGLT